MTHGRASSDLRRTAATAFLECAHTFVCAAYPLWVVAGSNAAVLPTETAVLIRAFVVVAIVTAALLWILRFVTHDLAARAMWLSMFFLLLSAYGPAAVALHSLGASVDLGVFGAVYTVVAIGLATLVIRPWQARRRNIVPMNALAILLLGANLYPFAAAASADEMVWQKRADTLIGRALPRSASTTPPERDIYYIVLDGFGRADVLREQYGVDLAPFLTFLQARGFYVPSASHSNYAQTYLSLASTLNLAYLDEIADAVGRSSRDRRPMDYLIQGNALMRSAKAAGYRVVAIGSDYSATERFNGADVCVCHQGGLNEFERTVLTLTPLAALPLDRWTFGAHRRKVVDSFEALERSSAPAGRTFTFAHLIAPHPPFIFQADGSSRQPTAPFSFFDGDRYPGSRAEYVAGYAGQIQFLLTQVTALVDRLLSRPGPAPAIIVHGDHGPGSTLRWDDPKRTNMRERMGIFAAYYLPGDPEPALSATMSPVNGARAVARRYLRVDLPPLPDESFFSTWNRPYEFLPVNVDAVSTAAAVRHEQRRPR